MRPLLAAAFALLTADSTPFTAAPVETVATGHRFTEGPVWLPQGKLLFSDIPADRIYAVEAGSKSVFREPSGRSNGLTLDRENRLLAAEHQNRRVSRTEKDGTITVLADSYDGKRLNSPNDLIVRSDGVIFFTDPPYGGHGSELGFNGVYAIHPDGTLKLLVNDFYRPNGLTLSPDEKILYIADSEKDFIRAYDLAPDATLSNPRQFCRCPGPDGIKTDTNGNIWATAADGVRIIAPNGSLLHTIAFPEQPANCAFGEDGRTLFVTARTSVYKVRATVQGILPGKS
jgi:gluconolactonase